MEIGKPFNPYRLFQGAYVPNWLLMRPEVSAGAKLCYGRLMQYAGKSGACFPRQGLLAEELGVQERQARRYVHELESFKLVQSVQTGVQKANTYLFLRHPWMSAEVDRTYMTGQENCDRSDMTGVNRSDMTGVPPPPNVLLIESVQYNHVHNGSSQKKDKEKKALELYALYPRKVGRAGALVAIGRALAKVAFDELKTKTTAFAAIWVGASRDDMAYCPHPKTWFSQERYLDDPAEWHRPSRRRESAGPVYKQIEAVEELILGHRCNPNSRLYEERPATPEMVAEYKKLKTKLADLRKQQSEAILAS